MKRRRLEVLALVAFALAATAGADERIRLRMLGGGASGLMTGGSPSVEPFARLETGWDVLSGERPLTARAEADLSSLAGHAVALEDATSFRSIRFRVGLSWKPAPVLANAGLYCEGSFASRYATGGREPVHEAPKSGDCGIRFAGRERNAFLQVGAGPTQELDGEWTAAISVRGSVDLLSAEIGALGETTIVFGLDTRLGLEEARPRPGEASPAPPRLDSVTVWTALAWGRRP